MTKERWRVIFIYPLFSVVNLHPWGRIGIGAHGVSVYANAPWQRMKLRIAERTINRLTTNRSGKEAKMFVAMVLHKHNKHNNGNNSNHHSSNNNSTRTTNNINNNHINNNVTNLNETLNTRAVSLENVKYFPSNQRRMLFRYFPSCRNASRMVN